MLVVLLQYNCHRQVHNLPQDHNPPQGEGEGEGHGHGHSTADENETTNNLNSWLPITASRKAKWWYAAFHNVTAMVGAGVLGLPLVLARLGWYVYKYFH